MTTNLHLVSQHPGDRIRQIMITMRNHKLSETDWTQMPDAPLTIEQKAAWATYRQALRDVPAQEGYPENIVWPTAPVQS